MRAPDTTGSGSGRRDDPGLAAAYRYCRRLNAQHGKTFYLATALLPAAKRPAVHALYGFARFADDIVDQEGADRSARLARLRDEVNDALDERRARAARHPVVRALVDTVRRFDLEQRHIEDFLDSMACDLTVARYPSFAELERYMWGSASVIGLLLLPILGVIDQPSRAEKAASDLGMAFQLTNFIRDVREDYCRGRIYLPQDSLAEHGVTESMLDGPTSSAEVRALIAAEVDRARGYYRRAEPGIGLLSADSRDCVRTAFSLYGEILTKVEDAGYQVLDQRVRVSGRRRLAVGLRGYLAARRSRRPS
jgi:phytoene synthase